MKSSSDEFSPYLFLLLIYLGNEYAFSTKYASVALLGLEKREHREIKQTWKNMVTTRRRRLSLSQPLGLGIRQKALSSEVIKTSKEKAMI